MIRLKNWLFLLFLGAVLILSIFVLYGLDIGDDVNDDCLNGSLIQNINGVWSCGNITASSINTSLLNKKLENYTDIVENNVCVINHLSSGSSECNPTDLNIINGRGSDIILADVQSASFEQYCNTYSLGMNDLNGYSLTFYFYAYRNLGEKKVYSQTPYILTFNELMDGTCSGDYELLISWGSVADVDGYKVVIDDNSYMGYYQDYYFDFPNDVSLSFYYGDGYESTYAIYQYPMILTPNSLAAKNFTVDESGRLGDLDTGAVNIESNADDVLNLTGNGGTQKCIVFYSPQLLNKIRICYGINFYIQEETTGRTPFLASTYQSYYTNDYHYFYGRTYFYGNSEFRYNVSMLENLAVSKNISGLNIKATGNISFKMPYLTGYDNSTQLFTNTSKAEVMNISNNVVDNWLIGMQNNQNITFTQTGDYLLGVSPQFYQSADNNKIISFWFQLTNSTNQFNDIPFSNSRFSMQNGDYYAPYIPLQLEITNITRKVRVMWYSDSTNSQLITVAGLTNPTRPSVPSVILNIQKISEVT